MAGIWRCENACCKSPANLANCLVEDPNGVNITTHLTPRILAVLRIKLRTVPNDLEDVTQDVLAKAFSRSSTWDGRIPFCGWVSVIAVTTAASHLRRIIPRTRLLRPWSEQVEIVDSTSPHLELEFGECITKVFEGLLPKEQKVFNLYFRHGLSAPESAEVLGIPVRTVYHWLSHIEKELRHCHEK